MIPRGTRKLGGIIFQVRSGMRWILLMSNLIRLLLPLPLDGNNLSSSLPLACKKKAPIDSKLLNPIKA